MEKRLLEEIIDLVEGTRKDKLYDQLNEVKHAYNSRDMGTALKQAYYLLTNASDYILTSDNMKTPQGMAKIVRYTDIYKEVKANVDLETKEMSTNEKGEYIGGCWLQREYNKNYINPKSKKKISL